MCILSKDSPYYRHIDEQTQVCEHALKLYTIFADIIYESRIKAKSVFTSICRGGHLVWKT